MKKPLASCMVALLLMSVAAIAIADPWDTVIDDPTPAQAIWVDPKNSTCINIDGTFVVDVLVNVTSPTYPGNGTGMFGFEYKLSWNSTVLAAESIQYHNLWPTGSSFVLKNETGSGPPHAPEGFEYHWLSIMAFDVAPFAGVASLCTHTFHVVGKGSCVLDIYDDILVDDTATTIDHTTSDGYFYKWLWPWDLNGDGKVTITDIVIIALAFGTEPGDPYWNPNADIDGSGKVTITDVVIAALHFGETDC